MELSRTTKNELQYWSLETTTCVVISNIFSELDVTPPPLVCVDIADCTELIFNTASNSLKISSLSSSLPSHTAQTETKELG